MKMEKNIKTRKKVNSLELYAKRKARERNMEAGEKNDGRLVRNITLRQHELAFVYNELVGGLVGGGTDCGRAANLLYFGFLRGTRILLGGDGMCTASW